MRFRATLKDPDTLYEAIQEALDENVPDNLSKSEWELVKEERTEDIKDIASKWFEYGEYLTVEIDTDTKTCTVVPVGE